MAKLMEPKTEYLWMPHTDTVVWFWKHKEGHWVGPFESEALAQEDYEKHERLTRSY